MRWYATATDAGARPGAAHGLARLLRMAPSGPHEAPSTFMTSLPAMIAVMPFALS